MTMQPKLSEEGKKEVKQILDQFKKEMQELAEEAVSDIHTDILYCIESDSWTNFRQAIIRGLKGYPVDELPYDFESIRRVILEENYDEIIDDLNQDLLEENKRLRERVDNLAEENHELRLGGYRR